MPASQARAASAIPGLRVRPVLGLSPSTLYITWLAAATSPEIARFIRHAVDQVHQYAHPTRFSSVKPLRPAPERVA
ncbi:MAG: hypothetical protein ACRDN0_23380 [Trebonia sp.]